jgi:hypothetical protein
VARPNALHSVRLTVVHHALFSRFESHTGLASKGLQIFVPLSPRLCLAIFDPSTYRYQSARRARNLAKWEVRALCTGAARPRLVVS